MEIAIYMERHLDVDEYAIWCIMVWRVWSYVCETTYGERSLGSLPREDESRAIWEAFQKVVNAEMRLGVECGERRWQRPVRGAVRVDVDAMFDERANRFGVGVILCDVDGRVRAAMSKPTSRKANVMIAEMMAVVDGIVLSMKVGVDVIFIYTDSLLVARLMACEEEIGDLLPNDICDIIMKARESMLEGVHHMYRSTNRAAHFLAQKSSEFESEMVWLDSHPSWLRDIVDDDSKT